MQIVAFDSETKLIRPGQLAPAMVCLTWQVHGSPPQIQHHSTSKEIIREWLAGQACLVGHNVAYDMAVICARWPDLTTLVFEAYRQDRVTDTMIRQQLLDVAAGVYRKKIGKKGQKQTHLYTLEALAKRCANIELQKDGWRLSYGSFIDTPLDGWVEQAKKVQRRAMEGMARMMARRVENPDDKDLAKEIKGIEDMITSSPEQCLRYPLEDARATLAVFEAQEKHLRFLSDQYRQARASWALHLSSTWGIRTDSKGVAMLRKAYEAELQDQEALLIEAGLVRPDGTRDTKAAKARMVSVCRRDKKPILRTDAHFVDGVACGGLDTCDEHVCLDGDACEEAEDEILATYSDFTTTKKVLSNDIKALEQGITYPVHTRYGFAATGRTTSSKPNIQNQSKRAGLREAFVPRPGMLFAQCDYPQLELYTLAQCCVSWLGHSKLGDTLLSGKDPHLVVAAAMLKVDYESIKAHKKRPDVKRMRDFGKIANFGFPGGLGSDSTVAFARRQSTLADFRALGFDTAAAKDLKANWFAAYPEMPEYFARVNALVDNEDGRAFVETLFTKRYRGQATYCATCNNGFQALGADCAKHAAWLLAEAEYDVQTSPLYGCRTVAFVHDEFILEVPDDERADPAARELAKLMVEGANTYLPNVPIAYEKMEPCLMRRWSKDAEQVLGAGRIIPWQPKLVA